MEPPELIPGTEAYDIWMKCMTDIETAYNTLAAQGYKADVCRMVLPHSTKASVIMTANLREWRHILKLRTAKAAHPTVRRIMAKVLAEFQRQIPIIFDDIVAE